MSLPNRTEPSSSITSHSPSSTIAYCTLRNHLCAIHVLARNCRQSLRNLWRTSMKTKALVLLLLLLLLLPFSAYAQKNAPGKTALPTLVPLKDFFRNPVKVSFSLSPNGEYLAFMQPWENRLNVFVEKIGTGQATRVTSAKARDISSYAWKGDNRIVYIQDTGGDENYRLYAVSIDGSNPRDLTPFEKVRAQIIDRLEQNENEILVGLN